MVRRMKVIFLDIDGVLNAHEYDPEVLSGQIRRDKVDLLNRILKVTGAKIVMSSAWRYLVHRGECSLKGPEWLLRSHGMLANRLIGVTRTDTQLIRGRYDGTQHWPADNERGQQISDWLVDNTVDAYVVIDDLDLGISGMHPFVHTDGTVGLTEVDAEKAINILGMSLP